MTSKAPGMYEKAGFKRAAEFCGVARGTLQCRSLQNINRTVRNVVERRRPNYFARFRPVCVPGHSRLIDAHRRPRLVRFAREADKKAAISLSPLPQSVAGVLNVAKVTGFG